MQKSVRRARKSVANRSLLARLILSKRASALFVIAIAAGVYLPTLRGDFVWDDRDLIVENPAVQTLDLGTVRDAFATDFWRGPSRTGGYYRPLTTLSYHIDYAVYHRNPWGFHLTNILANATVCVLVYFWLVTLSGSPLLALLTALLFALHPLHSENVAWISGRTDIFATLFALVALIFYVRARRELRALRASAQAIVSLAAFFVSLLYKESTAALPLVLIVLELPPCQSWLRGTRARIPFYVPTLPYLGVLGGYLAMRASVLGASASVYPPYAEGVLRFVALPLAIIGGYAGKLLVPLHLSAEWDVPVPGSMFSPYVLAGFLAVAGMAWATWKWRARPSVVLGVSLLVAGFAPVLNILPLGEVSAERFAYFGSLGFGLILAGPFARAYSVRDPQLRNAAPPHAAHPMDAKVASQLAFAFVAIALVWGGRTIARTSDWKNETTLFAVTATSSPGSARAQLNVGNDARRHGRIQAAATAYRKALQIKPDYPDALSNLAGLLAARRHYAEARALLERAAKEAPDNVSILANLGSLDARRGLLDEAARRFTHVLEIDPDNLEAHFNLGLVRERQKRVREARAHFERVVGNGQRFNVALYHLAVLAEESGNPARARLLARRFLEVYTRNDALRTRAEKIARGR